MKKLENVLNYVCISPLNHGIGALMASNFIFHATKGNLDECAFDAGLTAILMGLGYLDFKQYKKAKTALEKGWNEETIDKLVNKGGLFSKYIVGKAAKQTGYCEEFKELAERKDYRLIRRLK